MGRHMHILLAFRSFLVVSVASLGFYFLSSVSLWGIFLGCTLIHTAFLIGAGLRIEDRDLRVDRKFR